MQLVKSHLLVQQYHVVPNHAQVKSFIKSSLLYRRLKQRQALDTTESVIEKCQYHPHSLAHNSKMSLLPLQNKVLKVFQLSSNFREAVRVANETISTLANDQILVKNIYLGVNATDLNITAGRYFKHGPIPYSLGLEVCLCAHKCLALMTIQSLGQIVQLGAGITDHKVGEFVVVKPAPLRAYAEYLVM